MPIIESEEIAYRHDFSLLCEARKVDVAVEVGTDLGVFAKTFMSRFNGELVCIDPYESHWELMQGADRTPDMMMALQALAPYHGRVRFVRAKSEAVLANFPNWLLRRIGFVYIDACHEYDSVKNDIEVWKHGLRDNQMAILAGHDYDPSHPGVMKAVNELAENHIIRLCAGDVHCTSWYMYLQEPDSLLLRLFSQKIIANPYLQ